MLLICSVSPPVRADARRVVLVLSEGQREPPLDEQLFSAIRGQLQELGVEVLVVRRVHEPLFCAARRARQLASEQRALGVIWLELSPQGLSLFLYDGSGHLYTRDAEPSGSTAAQAEAVAVILRSALAALLEGESVSMTEVRFPPPSPRSAPSVPAGPVAVRRVNRIHVGAGLGYVGTLFAKRGPWQHGAVFAATVAGGDSAWVLGASYTYFPALALEASDVQVRLQRHPVEVKAGAGFRVLSLRLNAQAALSADYVARTTRRVGDGWVATPASARWLWAVSAAFGATMPVAARVDAVASVGADLLLNPFSQVVAAADSDRKSGNQELGSSLQLRPRLELGVSISVW